MSVPDAGKFDQLWHQDQSADYLAKVERQLLLISLILLDIIGCCSRTTAPLPRPATSGGTMLMLQTLGKASRTLSICMARMKETSAQQRDQVASMILTWYTQRLLRLTKTAVSSCSFFCFRFF